MNRIKIILKNQGRSQAWLAEHIGKSYSMVTSYCNNKKQAGIPVLFDIAKVLKVDVRELIEPSLPGKRKKIPRRPAFKSGRR